MLLEINSRINEITHHTLSVDSQNSFLKDTVGTRQYLEQTSARDMKKMKHNFRKPPALKIVDQMNISSEGIMYACPLILLK